MGRRYVRPNRYATLADALEDRVVHELKGLAALVTSSVPTRKADLIEAIVAGVTGARLRPLWSSLDPLQQAAVAAAVHDGPALDSERFRARHGTLPDFGALDRYGARSRKPTRLRLFFPSEGVLPDDLREALRAFVPPPDAPRLATVDSPPSTVTLDPRSWDPDPPEARPLWVRPMEVAALHDLRAVLRVVDAGGVDVTEKKRAPTAASTRAVADVLLEGDFYGGEDGKALGLRPDVAEEIGPMRAIAWPMLLQAGRLAQRRGRRLTLTGRGRKALHETAPEAVVANLWSQWETTTLLDEFSRVSAIRGQGKKGRGGMTAVAGRRAAVADALADLPPGEWVEVDELFRYMRAVPHEFEVVHDPWSLYIYERRYGSLGYEGYHDWSILQGRYTLAVLFEYAATLGMVDVAYMDPAGARSDFQRMWGADDLYFLSRYDGLRHVRLTALGAYVLGLADTYEPAAPEADGLHVLANLEIVAAGALSPADRLTLDRYAEPVSERVWRLDRDRALEAAGEGQPTEAFRAWLVQAQGEDGLPDTVARWLDDVERRCGALRSAGPAQLFECTSEDVAALIASDRRAGKVCARTGDRTLVVRREDETRFRKAVRALGYGLAGGG